MDNSTRLNLMIVTERPVDAVVRWVRFLLGDWAGDVVTDPGDTLVVPDSLIVCDRLDLLRSRTLNQVRRAGSVGLLHVGDHRYRSRLGAYVAFAFVWRTYYHSGLRDLAVRQLPLGPGAVTGYGDEPTPAALRPPMARLYTWSYLGSRDPGVEPMLEALRLVDGGHVRVGDGNGAAARPGALGDVDPVAVLADSVLAPCPSLDRHLETTRIYDALELGAIPVVERRRRIDYFTELLGDHPLPTVQAWDEAPLVLRRLLADQARLTELHERVMAWWTGHKLELAATLRTDVERTLVGDLVQGVLDDGPLNRPAPLWRSHVERLRHKR
jgi:hypothetical protein